MTVQPLRAVLIGLGRIGVSYSLDERTRQHFDFVTHADVLTAHPGLEWVGAADTSAEQCAQFEHLHPNIGTVTRNAANLAALKPDVAIVATPPSARDDVVRALDTIRGIIVEKPVGASLHQAQDFVTIAEERSVALQVNYWRRADSKMRSLADGGLQSLIGRPVGATCLYGGGLRNNGVHLVDLARMLLGEVVSVQAIASTGSGNGDVEPSFALHLEDGTQCIFQVIGFEHYREISLDIWGENGRLTISQEGLRISVSDRCPHRALSDAWEIDSDTAHCEGTGASSALYDLYGNLISHINSGGTLWSTGRNAIVSESVVAAVEKSLKENFSVVSLSGARG